MNLKNFFIFFEQTQLTLNNLKASNFNLYTKYLNNQSFNADYIYYWDRKILVTKTNVYKTLFYKIEI